MFKIKWQEWGARWSRTFRRLADMLGVEPVIEPAYVPRKKPLSGRKVGSILASDGVEVKLGEPCLYRPRAGGLRRGTLQGVKITPHGPYAWIKGKYLPLLMVPARDLQSKPRVTEDSKQTIVAARNQRLARALELYPTDAAHHEARAAERRSLSPA